MFLKVKLNLKKIALYIGIPLFLFILFKKKIDVILLSLLVKPIFSYVSPSFWLYDIVVVISFLVVTIYLIRKLFKGAILPLHWRYVAFAYSCIYVFYRIANQPFTFTSFNIYHALKLLDSVVLFFLIVCLAGIFHKKYSKALLENEVSFDIDEPITLNTDNDLLNRAKFIENLAVKMNNTNSISGSFPIGVVAPWGSGKTTFLNSLRNEIKRFDFISVELHLWKCNSADQIIETFFKLLSEQLSKYSFSHRK